MREVITTVVVRCNICGEKHTDMHPVENRVFAWQGREREMDLCPTDLKEVETMFEALIEKSQAVERKGTTRATRPRTPPYTNDTRIREFLNEATGLYGCPGKTVGPDGQEHSCGRQFDTPNGLAIHHKRKHGEHLLS